MRIGIATEWGWMSRKNEVTSLACNPNGCRGSLNHNVPNVALLLTRQLRSSIIYPQPEAVPRTEPRPFPDDIRILW